MDIASAFADHCTYVYVKDDNFKLIDQTQLTNDLNISSFYFKVSEIGDKLHRINISKGPGSNGISPIFRKLFIPLF